MESSLKYEVDVESNKLKIMLDQSNPIEKALSIAMIRSMSAFGYLIAGTNLLCIEMSLTPQLVTAYAGPVKKTKKPKAPKKKAKTSKEEK